MHNSLTTEARLPSNKNFILFVKRWKRRVFSFVFERNATAARRPPLLVLIREESMVTHVDVDVLQIWRDYKTEPTIELRNQLVKCIWRWSI